MIVQKNIHVYVLLRPKTSFWAEFPSPSKENRQANAGTSAQSPGDQSVRKDGVKLPHRPPCPKKKPKLPPCAAPLIDRCHGSKAAGCEVGSTPRNGGSQLDSTMKLCPPPYPMVYHMEAHCTTPPHHLRCCAAWLACVRGERTLQARCPMGHKGSCGLGKMEEVTG